MSNATKRYQKLAVKEGLSRIYRYPLACRELSSILRRAYNDLPKNLQSIIFQDTLTAFRLLPGMQSCNAVAAAHLLLQSVEAVLPKQKKNLAVTEYKQAMIALKRKAKARKEEKDTVQLPDDVLGHIFSFLDMQSLVSVGTVSWSWNLAANDNNLWQKQFAVYFGDSSMKSEVLRKPRDNKHTCVKEEVASEICIDWKDAFKRAYIGNASKKFTTNRGFCGHCNRVVWLDNLKCSNARCSIESQSQQIKPVSLCQVIDYILQDSSSRFSSSDSDRDSDEETISSLWAYPNHRYHLHIEW